jgi:hypothetical protein
MQEWAFNASTDKIKYKMLNISIIVKKTFFYAYKIN